MKRVAVLTVIAIVLVGLVGYAGFARSNATAAVPATCTGQCEKFVDQNHDGVCDLAAQCHASGQCACGKSAKDCPKHAQGAKCSSTCSQTCSAKCKATCGGHR